MPFYAFLLMCLLSCLFLHFINLLIAFSLFNAGSWNMGKGKADGVGFLRKVVGLPSRSGRARNPPPRLLDDEVGGQAVLGRQPTLTTPWLTERHG